MYKMDPHFISKITDSLYLSSYLAITEDSLVHLGITQIINVTDLKSNQAFKQIPTLQYMRVPIRDKEDADILSHLDSCIEKIQNVKESGGKTLVHCVMGMSRSATVCMAYLMKEEGMSLAGAYRHVKSCRSIIDPNTGFWRQLIQYEERVTHGAGSPSVWMVQLRRSLVPNVMLGSDSTLSTTTLIEGQEMNL